MKETWDEMISLALPWTDTPCEYARGRLKSYGVDLPDLNLLRAGDEAEWDKAFNWLWPTAYKVARDKLPQSQQDHVEDIAITSITKLIRFFRKVKSTLNRVQELKAILAKITHDESVMHIKKTLAIKHGGGNIVSLDECLERTGDQFRGGNASDDLENRDLDRLIADLAEQLKPIEKTVFKEFHINGLSYKEISEEHEIPLGSVGVHLFRALVKLRNLLKEKGEDYL